MDDDIGIISDGVLGYQSKIHKGEDLEALFMQVVKNSRAQEGGRHIMLNLMKAENLKFKRTFQPLS